MTTDRSSALGGPTIAVDAPGPDEGTWRQRVSALPIRDLVADLAGVDRVVVVAPHPDDETLGIGGTMQLVVAAGSRIDLVAVTDGEASHPGMAGLASQRRGELRTALDRLAVSDATEVHHLGVPDGEVDVHTTRIAEAVASLATPRSLLLAPVLDDGHPDHEAAARATAVAADRTGASVLSFPVWAWQAHDPATTGLLDNAWRVPLGPEVLARKRHAVSAFRSQVTDWSGPAIVPHHVRIRLLRDDEVLVAPCG